MFLPIEGYVYGTEIINRIKSRFRKPVQMLPDSERKVAKLPSEGLLIPVETALNSRCTSDYDNDHEIFHWGIFDKTKKISIEQIKKVKDLIVIPRFTDYRLEVKIDGNMLIFAMDNQHSYLEKNWMMIESGMQQQITCLICAALGIGMVFKSLGDNGSEISGNLHGNVRIKLDAMKPSYNNSYWTTSVPEYRRSWLKGNLPSPNRSGNKSLIEAVSCLSQNFMLKKKNAGLKEVSQLLWAARGRTPHFYKSRGWGMTIPVSRGNQNITRLLLIHSGNLFRYSNWKQGRPTHALEFIREMKGSEEFYQTDVGSNYNCHVILLRNETTGRSLWEIGYQMINMILQARASQIDIRPTLVDSEMKKNMRNIGIEDACALVSMNTDFQTSCL